METTAVGVLGRDFSTLLHNGDARWAVPDKAAVTATGPNDLQKLIQPLLAKGEIQIAIVGDTSVEDAIRETAATFGALPPRPEVKMADEARRMRFPDPTPVPVVRNHKGRTDQAAALVAWPTKDLFSDLKSSYAVYLLSDIVQERMRAQVRLTEGAAYTMGSESEMSTNLPGYGYLYAYVETPPNKIDTFFADMEKIVSDIRANGVTADELERSRAPKVEAGKAKLSNNDQWLSNIMLAQTEPRFLDILRYRVRYYQEVTSADIQKAAQAYLDSKKAFRMVVLPESAPLQ
jgi:zinc protease